VSFLGFEALTLVPIQTKMINPDLMRPEEVEWLDNYHTKVTGGGRGGEGDGGEGGRWGRRGGRGEKRGVVKERGGMEG
jgi:hypothetical protein